MSIILNGNTIAGHTPPQSYRFVGEIFQSAIPINDAKVALLDGHRITSSEGYGQFIQYITSVSFIYPQLACAEEEWQNTVTAYGECGKFVIGDSYVRLPKIVSFVQGLSSLNDLANIVEAGLPNITGSMPSLNAGSGQKTDKTNGAFKWDYTSSSYGHTGGEGDSVWGALSVDASLASPVYGNSDTVQPQAIQYPYYIVLATGVTQNIQAIEDIEYNIPHSLGESKYSPIALNNLSWLKSEGQWNPASTYSSFYDWLLKEYNSPDVLAKFNKDAFIVAGSPTITEDGVASGFSGSDYIQVNKTLNASSFTLEGQINVPKTLGVEYGVMLFSNTSETRVVIGASTNFVLYDETAGRIIGCEMTQFKGNTIKYKFEILPSGSKLTINDLTQNKTFTYTSTKTLTLSNVSGFIIGKSNNGAYPSSIDLKQFSITVDGVKTFSGADSSVKLVTEEYTDYDFVLNTTNKTFRLPLLDGSESIIGEEYETIPYTSTGYTYTAPRNGKAFWQRVTGQTATVYLTVSNVTTGEVVRSFENGSNSNWLTVSVKASRGDILKFESSASGDIKDCKFIYAKGNGSLYFYVGETTRNASQINVGKMYEHIASIIPNNNTSWDGQWVYPSRDSTYISWTTAGTKIIDLSEILPNDGYNYECLFNVSFYTTAGVQLYIGTDLCPLSTETPNWVYEQGSGKGNTGTIILAVGTGRQVQVNASAAPSGGTFHFRVVGYRRLGTNI